MKRRIIRLLPVAAAGLALLPLHSAIAADDTAPGVGAYVGGGAIYTRINNEFVAQDFPDDDDEFDDDRVSWKAFAGYQFAPGIALEGQYLDFGKSEGGVAEAKADGWTAALVAGIPLGAIQPYAKAGALFWDVDARAQGPLSSVVRYSDDGTDFFWGVGVQFSFSPALALRVEYERYQLDGSDLDTDIDAATAGLRFSF